jgi:hypothetical protein
MAKMFEFYGTEAFLKNFKIVTEKQRKAALRGLYKGGLLLQRESQKVVPVDTGNLKNSAFTRKVEDSAIPEVQVGYTAAYGIYVHENEEAKHAEGKMAKFLETPMRVHRKEIRSVIADEIKEAMK